MAAKLFILQEAQSHFLPSLSGWSPVNCLSECASQFPPRPFIALNPSEGKVQIPCLEKCSNKSKRLSEIVAKARPARIRTIPAIRMVIRDLRKPLEVPAEYMSRVRNESPSRLFNQAFILTPQRWSKFAMESKLSKIATPAQMAIAPCNKSLRASDIPGELYSATASVTRAGAAAMHAAKSW